METVQTEIQQTISEEKTQTPEKEATIQASASGDTMGESPQERSSADASENWSPNFKFKVKDKEYEIDEFIRPVIKDKSIESKIKELYEKAYGLDEVKADRQVLKDQVKKINEEYNSVKETLKIVGDYARKGDYGTFFQMLNIPKEKIIQYVLDELKYQELPAEERAVIDQQRKLQMDYDLQLQQNTALQKQLQDLAVRQTASELDRLLSTPDVASVVASFDARMGKNGAFREELIKRGQYYETVHKISPSVSDLVKEMVNLVGALSPASEKTEVQQDSVKQAKPTIPNFSGSSTKSPIKKVPNSLDDLRKLRQQLFQ